jgi:hypothetical protein
MYPKKDRTMEVFLALLRGANKDSIRGHWFPIGRWSTLDSFFTKDQQLTIFSRNNEDTNAKHWWMGTREHQHYQSYHPTLLLPPSFGNQEYVNGYVQVETHVFSMYPICKMIPRTMLSELITSKMLSDNYVLVYLLLMQGNDMSSGIKSNYILLLLPLPWLIELTQNLYKLQPSISTTGAIFLYAFPLLVYHVPKLITRYFMPFLIWVEFSICNLFTWS